MPLLRPIIIIIIIIAQNSKVKSSFCSLVHPWQISQICVSIHYGHKTGLHSGQTQPNRQTISHSDCNALLVCLNLTGIESMGLLWSLQPEVGSRSGIRLRKAEVTQPHSITLSVLPGHLDANHSSHHKKPGFLVQMEVKRCYMWEDVLRVPVRHGRLPGTLFIPQIKGVIKSVHVCFFRCSQREVTLVSAISRSVYGVELNEALLCICTSVNWVFICSNDSLMPIRDQAISWTNTSVKLESESQHPLWRWCFYSLPSANCIAFTKGLCYDMLPNMHTAPLSAPVMTCAAHCKLSGMSQFVWYSAP